MNKDSILLKLLDEKEVLQAEIAQLRERDTDGFFRRQLETLKTEVLFQSTVHGKGHIERTMAYGFLIGTSGGICPKDLTLLMAACSYHDIGRSNDGWDIWHGQVSARRLDDVIALSDSAEQLILKAAVESHSRDDSEMDDIIAFYGVSDRARARRLTQMLKDADGLDRVRLGRSMLDTAYLRCPGSETLLPFALWLCEQYK